MAMVIPFRKRGTGSLRQRLVFASSVVFQSTIFNIIILIIVVCAFRPFYLVSQSNSKNRQLGNNNIQAGFVEQVEVDPLTSWAKDVHEQFYSNALSDPQIDSGATYEILLRDIQQTTSNATLVSGKGTQWERIYAKPPFHTEAACDIKHQTYPESDDLISMGPKLCSKHLPNPYHPVIDQRCVMDVQNLDSYKMIEKGDDLRLYLDPLEPFHHGNVVHDRQRRSSASGIVFMGKDHFAVVSFALSILYVYQFDPITMKVILHDKIKNEFKGGQRGGEFTELVDFDGKDLLVCGNLRTNSFTLFRWDWSSKRLTLVQGTFPFPELNMRRKRQMTHGVRFYPSIRNSNIVAATAQFKPHHQSLAVRFFDWKLNKTKEELLMSKTKHFERLGPQDVYFINKFNMLVAYTPNKVTQILHSNEKCREVNDKASFSSYLVHYRLHFDLDDFTDQIFESDKFEEIQSIHYPHSHPDSISYNDGLVVMSDQYNDHITLVSVDPTGSKNMTHLGIMTGYHMNHGVALSDNLEHFAVTNYGDNSVILGRFPSGLNLTKK